MPSRSGTSTAFSESAIADSSLRSPSSLYRVRSCAEAADATTRAAISKMVENDFFITQLPCNDPLCVACPAPAHPCRKSCLRDSVGQTAQQFIDRGLRSRPRVDLLDDHRAVQRMRAVLRCSWPDTTTLYGGTEP